MTVRIPWDRYEVALLLNTYERVTGGSNINTEAKKLSETLRYLAKCRGVVIDDTFRNVNGMKMQLANVEYLFTNGEKGLSGASSMIRQMYELYKANPEEYKTILKEAIRMTGNTTMSVEEAFYEYAKAKIRLSPKMLAAFLQKAADYCHLKNPLLGMMNVKTIRRVQQKISEDKLFRFRFGKDAQIIRDVTQLYYSFIKNYRATRDDDDLKTALSVESGVLEHVSHDEVEKPIINGNSIISPEVLFVHDQTAETLEVTRQEAASSTEVTDQRQVDFSQNKSYLFTKPMNTADFRRKLDENFKPYLLTVKKLASPTAAQYSHSIEAVERFILEREIDCTLDVNDPDEAERIYDLLMGRNDFVDWNNLRHHQFSAALAQYIAYLRQNETATENPSSKNTLTIKDVAVIVLQEAGQPLTIAEMLQRIEERQLYKFGRSASTNLYISIRRYCKGMTSKHHAQEDIFERFTDKAGQIRYKLIGEEIKPLSSSDGQKGTPVDERWFPILQDFFPDGYILNDFLGQFQAAAFWQERYGEECPIQGDAIDTAMKAVGVIRDGRVFIKCEEDKQLIATMCAVINDILSHYTTVYRSCIYNYYQEQLAAISIYTESVMTQQLLEEAKGSFYSTNQVFAKRGQYASVVLDVRRVLRDHGGPMQVDDVAKVLWFIPRNMVYHYLSVDDESINIGNSTWMLAEHFPVTLDDANRIGNMLDEYFLTNNYVQAFKLMPLLQSRLPGIADNLNGMTYQAIFNIVAYYLRERYNFTKAIISPKGTSVDFTDLFRAFAADRDFFTLADLEALASELKLPIYWESTYAGGAVRVSKTEFVNRRLIQFDVDSIDAVLADLCPGDYLPLMSVSSAMMMHLASCGYPWNGYLLQSYVHGFSKVFRLSYSSFGKTGYYGAMVRQSCKKISNYGSLIERVLTDDDTWETTADALNILVKQGYQALRKYKGIDNVVAQARQNKLSNDGR